MMHARVVVAAWTVALAACSTADSVGPSVRPDSVQTAAQLDSAERAPNAPGDTLFASVTVAGGVSCALTRGGRAFCWGGDAYAQLGVAQGPGVCPYAYTTNAAILPAPGTCSTVPMAVDTSRRFVSLSARDDGRVCGLTVVGRIWCWGGEHVFRGLWLIPSGAVRYTALGDDPACAVRTSGSIDCFGWKPSTQAILSGGPVWSPLAGSEGGHYASISGTCATTVDGQLHCWDFVDTTLFATKGVTHDLCEGGGGPHRPVFYYNCHYPPVRMTLSERWKRPAEAPYSCCAVTSDGRLEIWSDLLPNLYSDDAFVGAVRPREGGPPGTIALPEPVQQAWIGNGMNCGLGVSGRLWCWGSSGVGQFGNGVPEEVHTRPTLAAGGRTFVSVDVASSHTCGVTADGAVYCWGSVDAGQLGIGVVRTPCTENVSVCVATPTRIASVAGLKSSG